MKLALVHDYLNQRGGAERVFATLAAAFPDAPIYTAFYDEHRTGDWFAGRTIHSSWLAAMPWIRSRFRWYAPFYPNAFERFDFSGYDAILSSSSAWAKGVRVPPGCVHLCYLHSVSRFLFDYDAYVGGLGVGLLARPLVAGLVRWDLRAAQRPTEMIANSVTTARRASEYYGRHLDVLHPPVDMARFSQLRAPGEAFLIVARLLPYKRVDLAIDAARIAGLPLRIVGDGPMRAALERRAHGAPVLFLGERGDDEIADELARARAVLVPGVEDFG
ncbi:MAG: glycosyltransferase, partial [Candidatus Eremiobacteraeota bacterium]|nr:glycosyltransferase [Candidatus Eremiobacteraeota bacterium]